MSLTIALATRGRPELLHKTLMRTLPNIKRPDTQVVILADADDARTVAAHRGDRYREIEVVWSIEEREDTVGGKFNRVLSIAPANVYMVMVDYVAYVTPGFDQKILDAASVFPDDIGVVYSHMANLSFPFMNAVTKGYVEKTGGIYPEHFPYWFVDHWLDDIAKMIGRVAFADVSVKMDVKPPTQGLREPAFWATLYDALTYERRRIAMSIIDSPDFCEPEWRKQLLRGHYPLIEERSTILNEMVKGIAALDKSTDERYERIRAKAAETMKSCLAELEAEYARAA